LWRNININQVTTKNDFFLSFLRNPFQAKLRLKQILFRNTWFKVLSDIFNWNAFFQNCFWLFRFSIQNMPIQNLSISDSVFIFVLFWCAQNIGKHLVWAESQSLQPTIHVLTSRQRVEGKARTESDRFPLLFSDSHLFLIHPILVCRHTCKHQRLDCLENEDCLLKVQNHFFSSVEITWSYSNVVSKCN